MKNIIYLVIMIFGVTIYSCTTSEHKETYEETTTIENHEELPDYANFKELTRSGYHLMIPKYMEESEENNSTSAYFISDEKGITMVIDFMDSISFNETEWAKTNYDNNVIGISNYHDMIIELYTYDSDLKINHTKTETQKIILNGFKVILTDFEAEFNDKKYFCKIISYEGNKAYYYIFITFDFEKSTDKDAEEIKRTLSSFRLFKK